MTKKQISQMLDEWSVHFDKDFHESYNKDLRSGHYRDLLDEFITLVDALNAAVKKRWWHFGRR
jgi:alpha-L-arabinofuranosidase